MEEKTINDSIHGHITMPPLCVRIIDTPEFQRLRQIKQLSLALLVYPGAQHSRFEHSLGVCYLAGEFVNHLNHNMKTAPDAPDVIDAKDKLCLQIAGLCHDLGHGPFSHLWETFVNKQRADIERRRVPPGEPPAPWEHEDISIQMFRRIIQNVEETEEYREAGLLTDDVHFIEDLIKGKPRDTSTRYEKKYLFEIISNKENDIDVDKWDYFIRDGKHLNLGQSFDYKRLLLTCRVVDVKQSDGSVQHIAYRDKDDTNILSMFRGRAELHYKALQHPVLHSLQTMLIHGLQEAENNGFTVQGLAPSKAHEDLGVYTFFTDNVMNDVLNSNDDNLARAKNILLRVLKRDKYVLMSPRPGVDPPEEGIDATSRSHTFQHTMNKEQKKKIQESLDKEIYDHNLQKAFDQVITYSFCIFDMGSSKDDPFTNIYFYKKNDPTTAFRKDLGAIDVFPLKDDRTRGYRAKIFIFSADKNNTVLDAKLTTSINDVLSLHLPAATTNSGDS